jgi:hypothetical protein
LFGDRKQYNADSGLMEEILCISDSRAIRVQFRRIGFVDRIEAFFEVFFLDSVLNAIAKTRPRAQFEFVATLGPVRAAKAAPWRLLFSGNRRCGPNRLRNLGET